MLEDGPFPPFHMLSSIQDVTDKDVVVVMTLTVGDTLEERRRGGGGRGQKRKKKVFGWNIWYTGSLPLLLLYYYCCCFLLSLILYHQAHHHPILSSSRVGKDPIYLEDPTVE